MFWLKSHLLLRRIRLKVMPSHQVMHTRQVLLLTNPKAIKKMKTLVFYVKLIGFFLLIFSCEKCIFLKIFNYDFSCSIEYEGHLYHVCTCSKSWNFYLEVFPLSCSRVCSTTCLASCFENQWYFPQPTCVTTLFHAHPFFTWTFWNHVDIFHNLLSYPFE